MPASSLTMTAISILTACTMLAPVIMLAVYRYIELNPIRAGMVEQPGDYLWSGYAANAWVNLTDVYKHTKCFNGWVLVKREVKTIVSFSNLLSVPVSFTISETPSSFPCRGVIVDSPSRLSRHCAGEFDRLNEASSFDDANANDIHLSPTPNFFSGKK